MRKCKLNNDELIKMGYHFNYNQEFLFKSKILVNLNIKEEAVCFIDNLTRAVTFEGSCCLIKSFENELKRKGGKLYD